METLTRVAKTPLGLLFFTIFLDLLGYGILIPVIPQLLANPDSPFYLLPPDVSLDRGFILLGFLVAIFPIGQFFATPILGRLSDRYGRKPILAISIVGTAISYFIFAAAILWKNIPLLFISRFFDGITGGNISVAQAAIADSTLPEHRSRNFGLMGAAFGLGFIIGPFIGGKLSDPHFVHWFTAATPFWFAGVLALCNSLFIFAYMRETNMHKRIVPFSWLQSVKNVVRAFHMKGLRNLFLTNFFYQGGFAFFTTFFSVFLVTRFAFTQGKIGNFFAFVGLFIVITQALITGRVAKAHREEKVLSYSIIASGILILLFLIPRNSWELLLIVPFFAAANGLTVANLTGLISLRAGKEVQGEVLGISNSVQALAQAIPPLLSGFIAAALTPASPLMTASLTIVIAGIIFILFGRKTHTQ